MLEPGNRRLFMDTLRPPVGFVLDCAVATTFTLDLLTLLSVPLAFTFRDAQDGDGQLTADPLSLLEGARRCADRIVVFCHGGQTGVPQTGQPALAFIEDSVVAAFPPNRGQSAGVFHPKVWVLRYIQRDRAEDGAVIYRLVCQSRNLTFDVSWDTSLVLDGALEKEPLGGSAAGDPLASFVRTLPALAAQPITSAQAAIVQVITEEISRVHFSTPEGLQLSRFLPFGIDSSNEKYPDFPRRPLLIISPFLDGNLLRSATERRPHSVLISRRDELLSCPADAIGRFTRVFQFRPGLEPEAEDVADLPPPLAGLHAKVYVIDDGWNARVAIGSANATSAALGNPPRNVEFMVELVGSKRRFGIDALLGSSEAGDAGTLAGLIEEFDPAEAGTHPEDTVQASLDRILDAAAEAIARAHIEGQVTLLDSGRYALQLTMAAPPALPLSASGVSCWPATLPPTSQQPLRHGTTFANLSLPELTAFLAVEVRADLQGQQKSKRFARRIPLTDLPEDRLAHLLARMVGDKRRLMQLLWMLLSPDQEVSFAELTSLIGNEGVSTEWGASLPGLLERMLETLGSDPGKLDAVASLLEELRKSDEGRQLVGPDFDAIWQTLWTVRRRIR